MTVEPSLRYAAFQWLSFTAKSLVIIACVAAFLMFGPSVQERFFPILSEQTITVTRTGNDLVFKIVVVKAWSCRIATIGWEIYDDVGDGLYARQPIDVISGTGGPTSPSVSYPAGRIVTGPFRVTLPPGWEGADVIEGILYYQCPGLPWLTRQIFGPVMIPPA